MTVLDALAVVGVLYLEAYPVVVALILVRFVVRLVCLAREVTYE